jgi:hypothetical protein
VVGVAAAAATDVGATRKRQEMSIVVHVNKKHIKCRPLNFLLEDVTNGVPQLLQNLPATFLFPHFLHSATAVVGAVVAAAREF